MDINSYDPETLKAYVKFIKSPNDDPKLVKKASEALVVKINERLDQTLAYVQEIKKSVDSIYDNLDNLQLGNESSQKNLIKALGQPWQDAKKEIKFMTALEIQEPQMQKFLENLALQSFELPEAQAAPSCKVSALSILKTIVK